MAGDCDDRAASIIATVTEVAAFHGVSNAAVAVAWLMSHPGVIPIAGPSKGHHMDAIEQALGLELSETDIERLSGGECAAAMKRTARRRPTCANDEDVET